MGMSYDNQGVGMGYDYAGAEMGYGHDGAVMGYDDTSAGMSYGRSGMGEEMGRDYAKPTGEGFYDESNNWVDLKSFKVDPGTKMTVDLLIKGTAGMRKNGENSIRDKDSYSEKDAEKLGKFDAKGWVESKGIAGEIDVSNSRMI